MIKLYWIDVAFQMFGAYTCGEKLYHDMYWFYKLAALAGLESSSEEI